LLYRNAEIGAPVSRVLKLSDAAGLGIHAATAVARRSGDGPVTVQELAEELHASAAHLGKVMNQLAHAQIVVSKRGPQGGFVLGPRAADATLLDIYELFDGPLGHESCLLGLGRCPLGGCILGDAVREAQEGLRATLGKTKISELAQTPRARRGKRRNR
jgi:Rrf2 family protein